MYFVVSLSLSGKNPEMFFAANENYVGGEYHIIFASPVYGEALAKYQELRLI